MSLPDYIATTSGEADAISQGVNGPYIHITSFRLGDAVNYTPLKSDTDIHGSLLYEGPKASGFYIGHNVWQCAFQVPQDTVVTFGEVGVFTSTGALAALTAYTTDVIKDDSQRIELRVNFVINTQIAARNIVVDSYNRAYMIEVYTVALLSTPSTVPSNRYLTHSYDEYGALPTYVSQKDANRWDIISHPILTIGSITIGGSTDTVLNVDRDVSDFIDLAPPVGRYTAQIRQGALAGEIRFVIASTPSTITVDSPFTDAPVSGVIVNVDKSLTRRLQDRIVSTGNASGIAIKHYHNRIVIDVTSGVGPIQLPEINSGVVGFAFSTDYYVIINNKTGFTLAVVPFSGDVMTVDGLAAATTTNLLKYGGAAEFHVYDNGTPGAGKWVVFKYRNDWTSATPPPPGTPANDNFVDAILIPNTVISNFSYPLVDNTLATLEVGETLPVIDATADRSLWWKITPSSPLNFSVDTLLSTTIGSGVNDGDTDTEIAIYVGSAVNSLIEITANDDTAGGGGVSSKLDNIGLMSGLTYHIAVTVFNNLIPPLDIVLRYSVASGSPTSRLMGVSITGLLHQMFASDNFGLTTAWSASANGSLGEAPPGSGVQFLIKTRLGVIDFGADGSMHLTTNGGLAWGPLYTQSLANIGVNTPYSLNNATYAYSIGATNGTGTSVILTSSGTGDRKIVRSTQDGLDGTWTDATPPSWSNPDGDNFAPYGSCRYLLGNFYVFGVVGDLYYSNTAAPGSWLTADIAGQGPTYAAITTVVTDIGLIGSALIVVGQDPANKLASLVSSDSGATWTYHHVVAVPVPSVPIVCASSGTSLVVSIYDGTKGNLWRTTDGITYTQVFTNTGSETIFGVNYVDGIYYAITTTTGGTDSSTLVSTDDGITWTPETTGITTNVLQWIMTS